MSGPANAVMGDDSFGTDLPETQIPVEAINEESNMAKFSQSREFQALKEHLEGRIKYYEHYLPGNVPPENVPDEERGKYWAVSNIVINEFNSVIQAYEQANQAVSENAA